MKSLVVMLNGVVDTPAEILEGRTPLEVASVPNFTKMAGSGRVGMIENPVRDPVEEQMVLGTLMGLPNVQIDRLRRAPLVARGAGVDCSGYDYAYCANLVTLNNGAALGPKLTEITLEEMRSLCNSLQEDMGANVCIKPLARGLAIVLLRDEGGKFSPGVHPSQASGMKIKKCLAALKGRAAKLVRHSQRVFKAHPINQVRFDLEENPVDSLWLWGGGRIDETPCSSEKGASMVFTNSFLMKGLAEHCGMESRDLTTPWNFDVDPHNFHLPEWTEAFRNHDLVFAYVEAPADLGGFGSVSEKIFALEGLDRGLLERLNLVMRANRPYQVTLIGSSIFSSEAQKPVSGPLPFVMAGSRIVADNSVRWSEKSCRTSGLGSLKSSVFRNMIGSTSLQP